MADHKKDLMAAIERGNGAEAIRLMRRMGIVNKGWADFPNYKKGDVVTLEGVKYWTGQLVDITDEYFVLTRAVWVANTGRFHESFTKGYSSDIRAEVENLPEDLEIYVRRDSVLVHYLWQQEYRSPASNSDD